MGEEDLPEDTSGTDGRRCESKHLGLSSSKPDISLILGVVPEWSERCGCDLPIGISPRE
jgi:hypothetical protein